MDDREQIPPDWLASLVRSKAQAERGESMPLEPFMSRLKASIDRMKREGDSLEFARIY
ncbi:hypothetical protein [Acidisoma silvae]|uniref:Uncharacterized protein n=1 Tax=Acidisoma silvae TaxID=2802396 RepID=A0A963YNJ9_9PROT|nr:hypothetical protein [Acidisoma silvae]MCB8874136.1 hypothetical protein [Acidisoma silvae]